MPISRYYSSTAAKTTLASAVDSATASMTLAAASGLPSQYPFTLIIDKDTANEEIVQVTGLVGSAYTVDRGVDGSTAKSHSIGATVEHGVSARDFADSRSHEAATTAHGVTGDIVGTGGAQAITGQKTLTSPILTGTPVITGLSSTGMVASSATPKNYVDAILGSATAASTSAASAATSATSAATSASSAATSATAAATSAASALASQTAAATSATSAAASASAASTSAASALASQTAAATSATSAAASATAAATSATSAAASATTAAASVATIAGYATTASNSAAAASTSATSAATSASSAATSVTSAAASATAASTSASSAATSASSALTSANSASASATAASTSASSAATSASSALTSANSAATSATSAAASATAADASAVAAAASAASVDATATTATELRQYAAEDSILPNLPVRVPVAEGLLRQAAYWVDATCPRPNYPGYIALDGANVAVFAPDVSSLDITGDIDLRIKIAADDWTPSSTKEFIGKWATVGNLSYLFRLTTAGNLELNWSADGTATLASTSSVAVGVSDGTTKWIRATLDVDNGASGNDAKFFTSDDGVAWTQLGTTQTRSGTTSIFNSSTVTYLGGGSSAYGPAGKLYRVQILNGIDGTTVLDANFETNVTPSIFDTFTPTVGPLVTIRGEYLPGNLGWTGDLLPTTQGSARGADSNDPKFLDWTGTNYVYLPGVASNYLSVPDSAALDITGDIDLRAYVAMDDWTPGGSREIIAKYTTTGNQRSYRLGLTNTGNLILYWTTDGSAAANFATSSVTIASEDGSASWVRATLDVDNGASGNDVKFYTSTDGISWTQLGTTITTAGTTSIYSGTAVVEMGTVGAGSTNPTAMKIFRGQIFNGIDGTKVLDIDTSVITSGAATSFYALSGQTVTINRSTSGRKSVAVVHPCWLFGTDDYMQVNNRYMPHDGTNYLYLPGASSNWATTVDAAVLDITGDIDIRVKVALDDWTPGAVNTLIAKATSSTTNRSYWLNVYTDGTFGLFTSPDGTSANQISYTSTVATGVADGATKWVRATLDVDNGASGKTATFFTSDDGTTWTQLGDAVTSAGTTSIFNGISPLTTGGLGAAQPSRGKFFRAQVLDGIDGTVVFDANFETSITSLLQASFTESSANAATVTIGRSGDVFESAGITQAGYLYPGATNTFRVSSVDYLNFGASDSFTVLAVTRQWSSSTATNGLVSKGSTSAAPPGYTLYKYAGGPSAYLQIADGTVNPTAQTVAQTAGAILLSAGVRDISSDNLIAYAGSTAGTAVTDTTTASLANFTQFFIGRTSTGGYLEGELVAAAVFRRALTAGEIATISTYYAGRVGA